MLEYPAGGVIRWQLRVRVLYLNNRLSLKMKAHLAFFNMLLVFACHFDNKNCLCITNGNILFMSLLNTTLCSIVTTNISWKSTMEPTLESFRDKSVTCYWKMPSVSPPLVIIIDQHHNEGANPAGKLYSLTIWFQFCHWSAMNYSIYTIRAAMHSSKAT